MLWPFCGASLGEAKAVTNDMLSGTPRAKCSLAERGASVLLATRGRVTRLIFSFALGGQNGAGCEWLRGVLCWI
jgi:hypothetical protein